MPLSPRLDPPRWWGATRNMQAQFKSSSMTQGKETNTYCRGGCRQTQRRPPVDHSSLWMTIGHSSPMWSDKPLHGWVTFRGRWVYTKCLSCTLWFPLHLPHILLPLTEYTKDSMVGVFETLARPERTIRAVALLAQAKEHSSCLAHGLWLVCPIMEYKPSHWYCVECQGSVSHDHKHRH